MITIKDHFSKLTLGTNWVRTTEFHIDKNDKKKILSRDFCPSDSKKNFD